MFVFVLIVLFFVVANVVVLCFVCFVLFCCVRVFPRFVFVCVCVCLLCVSCFVFSDLCLFVPFLFSVLGSCVVSVCVSVLCFL